MKGKKFFLGALFFAVCLILLDRGLGGILQHYYFKITHGEQGRTTYAIDSCSAELVILGSSRAAHHYVSPILSERLHISCYNAGKDKQRLRYCLAMLKMLYTRYEPKQIVLDLNPTAFEVTENGLDELSILLPYYNSHPEIRSMVDKRNRFEWLKTYSRLYCFNSLPLKIIFNNLSADRDANETNGFVPLKIQKEILAEKPANHPAAAPLDSSLINCFTTIIQLTRTHGSKLIIVVSPIYLHLTEDLKTITQAKSICKREKIAFLDFSQTEFFIGQGPYFFKDAGHLNDSAARVFTKMLSDELSRIP